MGHIFILYYVVWFMQIFEMEYYACSGGFGEELSSFGVEF